jgi:hypothetical protein
MIYKYVQETEVKSQASINEKQWLETTLILLIVFFALMWGFATFLQCV